MERRQIFILVVGYSLVAAAYITFSDALLFTLFSEAETINLVSVIKGWGFVLVTAVTLALLLLHLLRAELHRYSTLIKNHHAVMLLIDPVDGRILDASEAAAEFYGWSVEALKKRHIFDINTLDEEQVRHEMDEAANNRRHEFHFQHRTAADEVKDVDVFAGPIIFDGRLLLLSIVQDVTEKRYSELQLHRLNRLYAMLSETNRLITRVDNRQSLLHGTCEIAVQQGKFLFCWIGVKDGQGVMRVVARYGEDKGHVDTIERELNQHGPTAIGPAEQAISTGTPVTTADCYSEPGTEPLRESARLAGFQSTGAFPLSEDGKLFGAINFYSDDPRCFENEELETLSQIAAEVSIGLAAIRHRQMLEVTSQVIEASPAVLFRWRPEPGWPVQFVSENVKQWGYEASALTNAEAPFSDLVHAEDAERIAEEVAQYSATGVDRFSQRYRILTSSGESRWVDDRTHILRDEGDSIRYYEGVLTDITGQHEAELALIASNQRFRTAVEMAPVPIMLHAEDGEVLAISQAWVEITGYSHDDLPTVSTWTALAYGDRAKDIEAEIKSLYELESRREEGELQVCCANGERRDWDFSSVGLGLLPDGRRIVMSVASDVTSRNQTARDMEQRGQRQRYLLDNAPDMVFVNTNNRVSYINPAGCRLLGAPFADAVIGKSIYDLFAPQVHAAVRQRLESLRSQPGIAAPPLEEWLVNFQGEQIPVEVTAVSYLAGDNIDIQVNCRDIADRLEARRQTQDQISRLRRANLATSEAVSKMIELRDPYTAGHEQRVAALAVAIAGQMGLSADLQEGLHIAGSLHDVGKIVVPAEILSKPSRLSEAEFEIIKQHPQSGYEILKDVDFPWPVRDVVRQHHERLDGTGYPLGLSGDDICLEARIIAVADVVESMISHRPYRPGLGEEAALGEIERGAGTAYDPEVVAACLQLFREEAYQLPA